MLTTLEGTYRDGKVELEETPPGIAEGRVLVTFLSDGHGTAVARGQMMYFGMFPPERDLTEEDFMIAEFHGDPDDRLGWP